MGEKVIQPENDIFCSVYRKHYVFWDGYEHACKAVHDDAFRLTEDMAEKFLHTQAKLDLAKMEEYLQDMKELNQLRLRTHYKIEYPPKSSYKIARNVDPNKFSPENDKYLVDGAVRFGVPQQTLASPLPTARRVLGYSAYDDYRTPLSTYQDKHGRLGYEIVKLAAEGGYWRMGPRYDHEKEMNEIKAIMRREEDISNRESEEKRQEEELIKKQIELEREDFVRRSLAVKASRNRVLSDSSRFGRDPRSKSDSPP